LYIDDYQLVGPWYSFCLPHLSIAMTMFNKIAFRSLWRKRAFSFLNIAGLAVGIAASLLLFLVIKNEMSYDRYHLKADRIYRVVTTVTNRSNGQVDMTHAGVPVPLPEAMRHEFPGLEEVGAIFNVGDAQVYIPGKDQSDEKRFNEKGGMFFAEPSVFKILDFTWLAGNAEELKDYNTVVITKSFADAFFGGVNKAIGKTLQLWSYRVPLKVVGVFKDLPGNTDVPVRLAGSYVTFLKLNGNESLSKQSWTAHNDNSSCFVLASEKQDMNKLRAQLPVFVKKHYVDEQVSGKKDTHLAFQPLKEVHLDRRFVHYGKASLSTRDLTSLALIGVFLLLVACINFVNLATAQSVSRAKEIGVRKVLGSTRSQLLSQFLNETALITLFALLTGCFIAAMALPWLSQLMQKDLPLNLIYAPYTILYLVIAAVVITLLAGCYPAMILSGFNPVAAIKSKITTRTIGGISLRRGLVVVQFVIAQLLVIGTLVVLKQMQYFRSRPLGFTKDAVILINLPSQESYKSQYYYLAKQLEQVPGVSAASLCMDGVSSSWKSTTDFYFDNSPEKQTFETVRQFADSGYLNTFGLSMVAGRMPYMSDTMREVVVNEMMVKRLGLKSSGEILGKVLGFDVKGKVMNYPVVGVVHDFVSGSLREVIQPLILSTEFETYSFVALRLDPNKMQATLPQVEKVFTGTYPDYIYDVTFMDQRIGDYYNTESITAQLFKVFASLAIFISCLGLYGLISFMAVQKTKEVGIRKVLGASVQSIVYMFSKEFTILIGIAFVIAAPLGYYFMQEWLAGFYYHTHMGIGIFVMSVVISVVIAWITVGYKAVRAALANPVKSLKTE
jgi:putative ABC transport system permease protein